MLTTFKYRLLPNTKQAELIDNTINAARFVYNALLGDYKEQLELSGKDWKKCKIREVTFLKVENEWMKSVDSLALANAKMNLQGAFSDFWKSKKGKRKGKRIGFPKFHSRHKCRWVYKTNNCNENIRLCGSTIKLPKIGFVKFNMHRELDGEIRSVTVIKNRANTYDICVLVEKPQPVLQEKDLNNLKVVGLDLSYSRFVVDSEGGDDETKAKFIRHYRKNEKKMGKLQRRFSKKQKDSRNREKCRAKIAKMSMYISNYHKDFCHKLSRYYADNYDVVVVEDLNLQSMQKSKLRGHAKSVSDLCFGQFRNYLDYKMRETNGMVVKADKFFASSQICSCCGIKNPLVRDISIREWKCPHCGQIHDRDKNAAMNLKNWFLEKYNRAGTARIYVRGDVTTALQETVLQAVSLNREAVSNC
jgi:putative transposase